MFSEGGNEGWERFRKRQGKTLRKVLSKARKLEKNKSKQVKRFGNVEVEEGMGAAYMPKAGTQGVPEREVTSKAVKKQLNRNRNRAQMKGDLETPSIRYTHSRDKSTDYIRPVKKRRIHKKKVKEEVMIEGSKPNNPKLWAAKKAAAKAKFDVYPSAYANGWAAKQYKAAGGTWRSEAVEYPADAHKDLKKLHDKEKNTWWKHQDNKTKSAQAAHQKRMIDGARKSISQYNTEDYNAMKNAQAHAKKDGANYDRDVSVQHKYDAYHMKKAGYTHRKYGAYGSYSYNKHGDGEKITDKHHSGISESASGAAAIGLAKMVGGAAAKYAATKAAPYVAGAAAAYGATKLAQKKLRDRKQQKMVNKAADAAVAKYKETQTENIIAFPMARRAAQLTPQQKKKANADYKQKARDEIKKKMQQREAFGDRGISLQELGDPDKMNQLFRMGLAKKGELQLMQRMMKRGPDALKDPKLRQKMYDLLVDLTDLVTKDGQTFVKVRQNVQRNKKELQAVKELLHYGGQTILEVNTAYKLINIPEDMSGMSVSSGHKRSVDSGAGMTKKGVAAYRRRNPGSKLQTAVTTPPSKLKKGSKAAKRRKAFCSRSKSWTGERGKAARRRWNC